MRKLFVPSSGWFLIILVTILFGCKAPTTVSRIAPYSVASVTLEAGQSPKDESRIRSNCIFGLPKLDPNGHFGPTDLVARDGYVLIHSATDKIPLFVCEHVTAEEVSGKLGRDDDFKPDPLLASGRRAELKDYASSGFDRGHMAPAGDETTDKVRKAETFYLSNMAPQLPELNRKIWKELESQVREWAKQRGSVYIITGGMFYDPKEEAKATAIGTVNYKVIGPNSVAVPTHFYKIVVAKNQQGVWESIAFVMENKKYSTPKKGEGYQFSQYIQSIDWIEKRTGLNFMPELDSAEEKKLERTASPMWK